MSEMVTLNLDSLREALAIFEAQTQGKRLQFEPNCIVMGPRLFKLRERRLKRRRHRDGHLVREAQLGFVYHKEWFR